MLQTRKTRSTLLLAALAIALAACKPDGAAGPATGTEAQGGQATSVADAAVLKDEIETTDRYIVGISYPPGINEHPGLAKVVGDFARQARADLMQAVEAFGNDKPTMPYELSLNFTQVLSTPDMVAVAADGSLYTGGAHGAPLVARFVWLPRQQKLLTAESLVGSPAGWEAVSAHVREQLHTQVSVRADADELPPEQRAEFVRNADRLIDEGTAPQAANFRQFVPVLDAAGKIAVLRFVFPPYQVGPYADGIQQVDVPASVLRPHLAAEYAALFAQ